MLVVILCIIILGCYCYSFSLKLLDSVYIEIFLRDLMYLFLRYTRESISIHKRC